MNAYIYRTKEQVIQSYLTHRVCAITGLLGSGKTQFASYEIREIAQAKGWRVCLINRHHHSVVRIFRELASGIKSKNFNRAYKRYCKQLSQVDFETWTNSLEAIMGALDFVANLGVPVASSAKLGLELGSKILPPEKFVKAAESAKFQTGKRLELLINDPLKYLADALRQDLSDLSRQEKTLVLVDDFEHLSPLLEDWLFKFIDIDASQNITWIFVCWGAALPSWFPNKPDIVMNLDKQLLPQDEVAQLWAKGIRYSKHRKHTPKISKPLPFGGTIAIPEQDESRPLNFEQYMQFQGPPTFGLPIFAPNFPNKLKSRRGCWQPMIDHLKDWLAFDYPEPTQTQDILRNLMRCSVARYLDERITVELTGESELWYWLDQSSLLIKRSICGKDESALDPRLRCILLYELYRQNFSEYVELHCKLHLYYKEISNYTRNYDVEIWYHELCKREFQDILPEMLERFLDSLYGNSEFSPTHILEVWEDLSLENPNMLDLRSWLAPAEEALKPSYNNCPEEAFSFLSMIINENKLELLTPHNQRAVAFDYDKCFYDIDTGLGGELDFYFLDPEYVRFKEK